jgi:lipopolysaccharide export system protein LptA
MAQNEKTEPIEVVHADKLILDEKYPDLKLLVGNVVLKHKDALLTCDKALLDIKNNFAEAIDNVQLNQGDTLFVTTGIMRYDGNNESGVALGNVFMRDPKMQLQTDTLYYDMKQNLAYYEGGGTVRDTVNVLKSYTGKYFTKQKRYEFTGNVVLTNPEYTIESAHLNYNTSTATATFYGPTKILGDNGMIYAEKGFYDTQNDIAWFTKNTFLKSGHSRMTADSVYMDKNKDFYSATGNVRMKDTVNKVLVLAGYVEQWRAKDSVYLSERPVMVNYENEQDSLFLSAGRFYIRGKKDRREIFAYPGVKFYQKEFSGMADSLYRSELKGVLELHKNPVIWNKDSQITGSEIIVKYDSTGRNPDSLFIPSDVFIIQKDSAGYNQIKGKRLRGKFIDGRLRKINIQGNTETIYYIRDEKNKLVGIDKSVCSEIEMHIDAGGQVETVKLIEAPQGTTYPPDKFPGQLKFLDGFKWLGDKRITSSKQILQDENIDFREPEMKATGAGEKQEKIKLPKKFFRRL